MSHIQVTREKRLAILTVKHALDRATVREMRAAVDTLAQDDRLGVLVITGEADAFVPGGEVEDLRGRTKRDALSGQTAALFAVVEAFPCPVIAAINGAALGDGFELALACDLRIASDQARFGTAFANVGFSGDFGVTWGLTHAVGPAKAKELFFLPDLVDAQEALRLGLVNRVYPHEGLWSEALAIAERIAGGPGVSYRYMKANINAAVTGDFRSLLEREAETHIRCGETADHAEGVAAFVEKREPRFQGR